MITNYEGMWKKVLKYIKERVSPINYCTYYEKLKVYEVVDNVFIIETDIFVKNNIETDSQILKEAFSNVLGPFYKYFIKLENDDITSEQIINFIQKNTKNEQQKITSSLKQNINLNPNYTFDKFVVGNNNNIATAACQAVAKNPGKEYNPLFLYGPVGIGKTHLLQAVANYITSEDENSIVTYVTSETFTNDLINSLKNATMPEFRDKYRQSDILIIDDIQFIAGKNTTQEEFFHTFNHLYQSNKQIVVASDRPPYEISQLEERIKSRFNQGLICDIQLPDYETRVAILKKKTEFFNLDLSDDIITFLAKNIQTNTRNYEGALTKIKSLSHITSIPLNLDMIKEYVKDFITVNNFALIDIDLIKKVICRHFSISITEMNSKSRKATINKPRQLAMYLCRELINSSYSEIGESFGGRDHSTVINAFNKIEEEKNTNINTQRLLEKLIEEIKGEK